MRLNHTLWGIIVAAAFVSGAFLASPELRAYAADTVFSTDIVDGEVKSVDIGTGEVKSPDIASNAIVSFKIKDGTIQTQDLGNGIVTNDKLAPDVFDDMQAQIDGLTAENAAQQAQIDDLTARVEALEGGGTDPNDVDDDSDGFTENQGDCDDTDANVNPDANEIANGIDDNCNGQVDEVTTPTADIYEPNDSQLEAADIGDTNPEAPGSSINVNANFHVGDTADWYQFTYLDSNCNTCGVNDVLDVSLTGIPEGSNYDLIVHDDSLGDTYESTNAGNQNESIVFLLNDADPDLDSRDIWIEVRMISGEATSQQYALTVTV